MAAALSTKGVLLCSRSAIKSYEGGFRFASGRTPPGASVLILADGVYLWPVSSAEAISAASLAPVLEDAAEFSFLLLGTGRQQIFPPPALVGRLAEAGLGIETMATAPACRTYNILIEENRRFAAALIGL